MAVRLNIPPRTQLQTVWRTVSDDGLVEWQVWTACANQRAPYREMLGTYMLLQSDGSATRVTVREDFPEDMMLVMPAIGDT